MGERRNESRMENEVSQRGKLYRCRTILDVVVADVVRRLRRIERRTGHLFSHAGHVLDAWSERQVKRSARPAHKAKRTTPQRVIRGGLRCGEPEPDVLASLYEQGRRVGQELLGKKRKTTRKKGKKVHEQKKRRLDLEENRIFFSFTLLS